MKAVVIGVVRRTGVSDKGSYDMTQVLILQRAERVSKEKFAMEGVGYQVAELDAQPSALDDARGLKFPVECELTLDHVMARGRLQPVVCSISPVAAAAPVKVGSSA